MIAKIVSLFTVGVAALLVASPSSLNAASAVQAQASIASLKKQLNALPKHAAPFAKVKSLVTQLSTKDPKKAASYLKTGQDKIATVNATKNSDALSKQVSSIVKKSKTLTAKQKKTITSNVTKLQKAYIPPSPTNPPYQAMLSASHGVLV